MPSRLAGHLHDVPLPLRSPTCLPFPSLLYHIWLAHTCAVPASPAGGNMFDVEITRMALAVEDPDQLARVSLTRSAIASLK